MTGRLTSFRDYTVHAPARILAFAFGRFTKGASMGSFDFEHCGCKQHFACFACRKAFKAKDEFVSDGAGGSRRRKVVCPDCNEPMRPMGLLFRAPSKRAVKAWKRLETLAMTSPHPPFQYPGLRASELPPPGYHCGAKMVDGRCAYCGFSRRAASGGRRSQDAYKPGRRRRRTNG